MSMTEDLRIAGNCLESEALGNLYCARLFVVPLFGGTVWQGRLKAQACERMSVRRLRMWRRRDADFRSVVR